MEEGKTGQELSAVFSGTRAGYFSYPQGFGYHRCLGLGPRGTVNIFQSLLEHRGVPQHVRGKQSLHHDEPYVKLPTNVLLLVFTKPALAKGHRKSAGDHIDSLFKALSFCLQTEGAAS